MKTLYTFLHGNNSQTEIHTWLLSEWYKIEGELRMWKNGFHGSENIQNSMRYLDSDILAVMEVCGKHTIEDELECWSEARIIKVREWGKEESLKVAIFAGELVLKIFEGRYPDDERPREAIEAAKAVLRDDVKTNRDVATSKSESAMKVAKVAFKVAREVNSILFSAGGIGNANVWGPGEVARAVSCVADCAAGSARESVRAAGAVVRAVEKAAWVSGYKGVGAHVHNYILRDIL